MKELTEVPFLVAEDMCHGAMTGPDDTHCLIGWVAKLDPKGDHGLLNAVRFACLEREGAYRSVGASNDSHTLAENANLWNLAMRSLGYHPSAGTMVI